MYIMQDLDMKNYILNGGFVRRVVIAKTTYSFLKYF